MSISIDDIGPLTYQRLTAIHNGEIDKATGYQLLGLLNTLRTIYGLPQAYGWNADEACQETEKAIQETRLGYDEEEGSEEEGSTEEAERTATQAETGVFPISLKISYE